MFYSSENNLTLTYQAKSSKMDMCVRNLQISMSFFYVCLLFISIGWTEAVFLHNAYCSYYVHSISKIMLLRKILTQASTMPPFDILQMLNSHFKTKSLPNLCNTHHALWQDTTFPARFWPMYSTHSRISRAENLLPSFYLYTSPNHSLRNECHKWVIIITLLNYLHLSDIVALLNMHP